MALNFYAPMFFLLNKYDQEPEQEDAALEELEIHVKEFSRIYLQKGDGYALGSTGRPR